MTQPRLSSKTHIIAIGLISAILVISIPLLRTYLGYFNSQVTKTQSSIHDTAPYIRVDNPDEAPGGSANKANANTSSKDQNNDTEVGLNRVSQLLKQDVAQLDELDKFENCMITSISFEFPNIISTTFVNRREESCDTSSFNKMNGASVRAQLETITSPFQTGKSGPYRDTATKNLSTSSFPFIYLGSQKYSISFKVKIGIMDFIKHPQFAFGGSIFSDAIYYPLKARQNLNLFWAQGEPAYCLIDPAGHIYLMTHYSTALLPNLTRDNLEVLDKLLVMPVGWKFTKVIVTKPVWITENFENGFVVEKLFDNLGNFYIRANLQNSVDYSRDIAGSFKR